MVDHIAILPIQDLSRQRKSASIETNTSLRVNSLTSLKHSIVTMDFGIFSSYDGNVEQKIKYKQSPKEEI